MVVLDATKYKESFSLTIENDKINNVMTMSLVVKRLRHI